MPMTQSVANVPPRVIPFFTFSLIFAFAFGNARVLGHRPRLFAAGAPYSIMKKKTCYLTELDVARLEKHAVQSSPQSGYLAMLDELMERASIVDSREISANVVTMNSKVTLVDSGTGEPMTWTVVYPPQADFANGKLNVFSPAGLALLGTKRGDTIRFTPPSGQEKTLKVDQIVFQPEAADDFTL